jgi:hypothetical protein
MKDATPKSVQTQALISSLESRITAALQAQAHEHQRALSRIEAERVAERRRWDVQRDKEKAVERRVREDERRVREDERAKDQHEATKRHAELMGMFARDGHCEGGSSHVEMGEQSRTHAQV